MLCVFMDSCLNTGIDCDKKKKRNLKTTSRCTEIKLLKANDKNFKAVGEREEHHRPHSAFHTQKGKLLLTQNSICSVKVSPIHKGEVKTSSNT